MVRHQQPVEWGWRERLRTITTTAVATSVVWLIVGAVLFSRVGDAPAAQVAIPLPSASPQALLAPSPVDVPDGRLLIPVQGVRADQLTDTWGQSRSGARVHQAIDIMAQRGTPVQAAAPGTVEKLFVSAQGGNTVYLRSLDRQVIYYYAHLDRFASGLTEKQSVQAGQVIGYVGSTGNASLDGPHLHFAVNVAQLNDGWWKGEPINPYPLLRGR